MSEKQLKPGFYWVRLKSDSGTALVMELSESGKWYMCGIDFAEAEDPEVLSDRLQPPGGVLARPALEGLLIVGEDIPAGSAIKVGHDMKLYIWNHAPPDICTAGDSLREGFRAGLRPDNKVYEDDA